MFKRSNSNSEEDPGISLLKKDTNADENKAKI